ncbi:MAG: hypothetical protein AMXMBFR84_21960 [Candidatus Hydrogenedentota bacterium]
MRNVNFGVCLVVGLTFMSSCSPGTSGGTAIAATPAIPPASNQPVIPIEAKYPERGDISEYFKTTSRIAADKRVDVTAQGMGKCLSAHVDVGDRVEKGQVVAELDKEEVQTQLAQARIQLSRIKNDMDRSKMLFEEGLGPRSQYENDMYAYKQQQATVAQQEIQLRNMTVRAPISGIIISRSVQVGMYVSSGSPLYQIIDPSTFELMIDVPEQELARVEKGQAADVYVDILGDESLASEVSRISPSVQQDGTVQVTLRFPSEVRSRLKESAFARVNLVLDTHKEAILIPKDSVIDQNGNKYVFIATANDREDASPIELDKVSKDTTFTAKRVQVELGLEDSNAYEIVNGVAEGDLIVTLGHQALKDGALVRLTNIEDELMSRIAMSPDEALTKAAEERAKGAVNREPGT